MVPKLNLRSMLTCKGKIHTKGIKLNMYRIYCTKQQQYEHKQQGRKTSKSTAKNQQYICQETLQQSNFFKRFLKAAIVGAETTLAGDLFQISVALCVKKLFKYSLHGLLNGLHVKPCLCKLYSL